MNSGTVNNQGVISVVSADGALIGVAVGPNGAQVASYNDDLTRNTITLDFRRGVSGSTYGFGAKQATPSHKFYYRDVLMLTNNSGQRQCVAVYLTTGSPVDVAEIQVRQAGSAPGIIGSGPTTWSSTPSAGRTGCRWMEIGQQYAVDFLWEIKSTSTGSNQGFSVLIEAQPVNW